MRQLSWRYISRCVKHDNASSLSRLTKSHRRPSISPLSLPSRRRFNTDGHNLRSDPSFFSSETDVGLGRPKLSEDAILERAKIHGINSLDQLAFEAGLRSTKQKGKPLLKDDSVRQDLDLWAVILDYRSMKDGRDGVKDVLLSMLYDGEPVKLQADAVSEHIWNTILSVAITDEKTLYELCQAGSHFFYSRPTVFTDIVGQLLAAGNIRLAITFGTQFLISYFRGHADLMRLFDVVLQVNSDETVQNFAKLIARLPANRVYKDVIPQLWNAKRPKHAFILHKLLVAMGDHPTEFEQIEPFVLEIAAKNIPLESFLRELEQHNISYSHQARQLYSFEKSKLASIARKEKNFRFNSGPGTRPVKLSDTFVARSFATSSISFDFVLNGLKFVGLFEIGPLAIRQIASGATDIDELKRRFKLLEEKGIDLGVSNYVRVVKNLCMADQEELLRSVIESDMHHEVYEDVQNLKRLLTDSQYSGVRERENHILSILNGGRVDSKAELASAQLILQTLLVRREWRTILMALDTMRLTTQESGNRSDLAPMRYALRCIWADSTVRERHNKEHLDRHLYLVGFTQLAHTAGLSVYPWQWRSVLHAVGRSRDWELLQSLAVSLARIFSQKQTDGVNGGSNLDIVFDAATQSMIYEASIVTEGSNKNPKKAWTQGMRLLHTLRDQYGVNLDYQIVSDTFKIRLQALFNGFEVGFQRRIINYYLSCFGWAWSEVESASVEKLPHALYQRGVVEPDQAGTRLFHLKSTLIWYRRKSVGVLAYNKGTLENRDVAGEGYGYAEMEGDVYKETPEIRSLNTAKSPEECANTDQEQEQSTVFYSDLLHPSYKSGVRKK